jgi:uncharacterized membrane protein
MRLFAAGNVAIALVAAFTHSASAELRVCNRSTESVSIAAAYYSNDVAVSRGWYTASAGSCVTVVSGDLTQRFYYIRAEASTGGNVWGDDYTFCVTRTAFDVAGVRSCANAGYTGAKFFRVDTGDDASFTEDLTPAIDPQTMHDGIRTLGVTWRLSTLRENTYVLQLSNSQTFSVNARVRCYERSGASKTFPLTIRPGTFEEIGFIQGWDGNFVSGEHCELYHDTELVRNIGGPE